MTKGYKRFIGPHMICSILSAGVAGYSIALFRSGNDGVTISAPAQVLSRLIFAGWIMVIVCGAGSIPMRYLALEILANSYLTLALLWLASCLILAVANGILTREKVPCSEINGCVILDGILEIVSIVANVAAGIMFYFSLVVRSEIMEARKHPPAAEPSRTNRTGGMSTLIIQIDENACQELEATLGRGAVERILNGKTAVR